MNKKILIVDDELKMRILIKDFLKRANYDTIEASNGEDAINLFIEDKSIDLIILDVMMPKLDGWETCKKIRQYSNNIPILMLTAKSENEDVIRGFQTGADDYLTKPFHMPILLERIMDLLKRTQNEEVLVFNNLYINLLGRVVKVNDKVIDLSVKEYDLLLYLIENKDVALTRDDIIQKVWNYDFLGDGRTIDTHIKTLRNKLGSCGEFIKTVWGIGYKFEVD